MNITKKIFLALLLVITWNKALSCSMGFSFSFEQLSNDDFYLPSEDDGLVQLMNSQYGENKWSFSDGDLRLNLPEFVETPYLIAIEVGSKTVELAGKYKEAILNLKSLKHTIQTTP